MPRKQPADRRGTRPRSGPRHADAGPKGTIAELEAVLDALLEEGIGSYDARSDGGRRRMAELYAGFSAGEALLAGRGEETGAHREQERIDALAGVIRYILHWAGEERTLEESPETIAAMRAARRALERASGGTAARQTRRPAQRRRGGAA